MRFFFFFHRKILLLVKSNCPLGYNSPLLGFSLASKGKLSQLINRNEYTALIRQPKGAKAKLVACIASALCPGAHQRRASFSKVEERPIVMYGA